MIKICEFGTYKLSNINEKEICIDACIAEEIELLNTKGVITKGCCCGHGEYLPTVLIDEKSVKLMIEFGYKYSQLIEYEGKLVSGVHEFFLKSGCKTKKEIEFWQSAHVGNIVFRGFVEGYDIIKLP